MTHAPAHAHRVLVVDDDRAVREALNDAGFQVVCATNGRELLEYLHRGPAPCLILLDLMMPVMDGAQFRREQVREPELKAIPTVLPSAAGPGATQAIRSDDVLQKPVGLDALLGTVARHCAH